MRETLKIGDQYNSLRRSMRVYARDSKWELSARKAQPVCFSRYPFSAPFYFPLCYSWSLKPGRRSFKAFFLFLTGTPEFLIHPH